MTIQAPARPILPVLTADSAPFWRYAAEGELRMQRCSRCGLLRWPPGPVCPECWHGEATWELLSGTGRLRSWVVYRRQYFPEFPVPYAVGLVELEEGPRYSATLDIPLDDLRPDLPVRVAFRSVPGDDGDVVLPVFVSDASR